MLTQNNNWKLLASKAPKSQRNSSEKKRNTSKKYEPRKEAGNQEISFISPLSKTFSKNNESFLGVEKREKSISRNSSILKYSKQEQNKSFSDLHDKAIHKSKLLEIPLNTDRSDIKKSPALSQAYNQNATIELERLKK